MRRRPWPIVILAVFQIFLEPFSNLFLNSWFSGVSPRIYLDYFFEAHQWLPLVYLFVLPPVMGAAAYAMKKWSYIVFVAGATWMLFHNFSLVHEGEVKLSYAIALYIGNIGFVSYFLLPQVHRPYMNPKLRWWESKTRFIVDWPCRVSMGSFSDSEALNETGAACRIQDFSEGGVFLLSDSPLTIDQVIQLRMSPTGSSEIIAVQAKSVFSRPVGNSRGYGVQFVGLDRGTKGRLAKLARSLKKSGVVFRNGQESSWSAFKSWATRLLTTGHGLVPEMDGAVARPAASASSRLPEKSSKTAL